MKTGATAQRLSFIHHESTSLACSNAKCDIHEGAGILMQTHSSEIYDKVSCVILLYWLAEPQLSSGAYPGFKTVIFVIASPSRCSNGTVSYRG